MATISELNVRLGLLYKDFDKSLSVVEKRLERTGRTFSQLGNDLALSISLPLGALAASAIKQAGEIESLKLAMVSTFRDGGRSAEEATAELEKLRQAAKAPGLDFEQAVKGSIRLQGVGLAAEEAREILEKMANAIALTGGTADDLDGVTRQFAQMLAKGRVLQEDVSILAERMPVISKLMQDAFGTASVEAIRASGVSAKQFVERITEAAGALDKVEGGIKNAIVNAGAEARQSLATLGETISKTFDVKGKIEAFTAALSGAVQWFTSLSESTQRAIVGFGAFVAILGPAIKLIGITQIVASQAVTIFGVVAGALKSVASAALFATSSMNAFRVSTIIATGGIAAIMSAITIAFLATSDSIDTAKVSADAFAEATAKTREEGAKEVAQLTKNIDALKDVRTSTEDRKKAADALLKAYPEYLSGIDLEKASLEKLDEIQNRLNRSIIQGIAERKKADAVNKVYEKQAEILLRIQEIQRTKDVTVDEAGLVGGIEMIRAGSTAAAVVIKLKEQVADLGKQAQVTANDFDKAFGLQSRALDMNLEKEYAARQAAEDLRSEYSAMGGNVYKAAKALDTHTGSTSNSETAASKLSKTLKGVTSSIDAVNKKQELLGQDFIGEKTKEIENGIEKLIEAGFSPSSAPVQKLKGYLKDIRAEISKGFGSANAAQTQLGVSPTAPAALPTIDIPDSVASVQLSGADEAIKKAKEMTQAFDETSQAYQDFTARMSEKQSVFAAAKQVFADLKAGAITWLDGLKQLSAEYGAFANAAISSAVQIAEGFIQIAANRGEREKDELQKQYDARIAAAQGNASAVEALEKELAAKKAAIDKDVARKEQRIAVVKAIIDTASAVTKALGSAAPPLNFVLAGLAAAAGAVQIGVIKSQKFAKGGVIKQPTVGLVGEYAGASQNPEIITPERLMRSIFREESGNGGMVEVYGVIRGADIEISNRKAQRERGRIR